MANKAFITGDVRPGAEFEFITKSADPAASTFVALVDGKLIVTRYAVDLFGLPNDTPVLAHWHGRSRTEGFTMTVAELKAKAETQFGSTGHASSADVRSLPDRCLADPNAPRRPVARPRRRHDRRQRKERP